MYLGRGFRLGSDGAAGQWEQAHVAALVGESRQLVHVAIAVDVAREVGAAEVEEHALDEQVDQLIKQPALERVVALDELNRTQDIVLLSADPLDQPVLCIHDQCVRRTASGSLPLLRFCWVKPCEMGRTTYFDRKVA